MDLAPFVRNVPDFPKPGIQFKDVTTVLMNPEAFKYIIDAFHARYRSQNVDVIVGMDARGFIFGSPLAYVMSLPFAVARKKGKLPSDTFEEAFELEYGQAVMEMHTDAIRPGQRVLIVDDLLATGGTTEAVVKLIRRLGGEIIEAAYVIELPPLNGRARLQGVPVFSLVEFMVE